MSFRLPTFAFLIAILSGLGLSASANDIRFAQIAPFKAGPVEAATAMQIGIRAAFEEANRAGGINGRQLVLDSFDDSYQPDRTISETRRLITQDKHLGFIGNYGTATSTAAQPLAMEAGWPFISPLTGADFLRDPTLGNVFNIRQTYGMEMAEAAAYLIEELGLRKIAILYQDDGLGLSGLRGILEEMEKQGIEPVAQIPYTRKTTAVKVGLMTARRAEAEAVLMVALRGAARVFIQTAHEMSYHPVFVNNSIVGSKPLRRDLGALAHGVLVTQVVPSPYDASLPVVGAYQAAMQAAFPEQDFGFISLEGYIAGRVTIEALRMTSPRISRQALITALTQMTSLDLGGLTITYGPDDNQGLRRIFLTEMTPEGYKLLHASPAQMMN